MYANRKKYEVSDPTYFRGLIKEQKRLLRKNPTDPAGWVKLGRFYEKRICMLQDYSGKIFYLRHFKCYLVFILMLVAAINNYCIYNLLLLPWGIWFTAWCNLLTLFFLATSLRLRYPRSGKAFFKKAIELDPGCGEAYHCLGQIALRRGQMRQAIRLLEHAVSLNVEIDSRKLLDTVYRKEFKSLLEERMKREARLETLNEQLVKESNQLRSINVQLEKRIENLTQRVNQAKWDAGHRVKVINQEMNAYIERVKKNYEAQIIQLQEEAEEEVKELAAKDRVKLTTEIMESKVSAKAQSINGSDNSDTNSIDPVLWRSMSELSQLYLSTAEKVYASLLAEEEKSDFSLVGMELCKALESEINRKLVTPFVEHLNGNRADFLNLNRTGEQQEKPIYFTYLAKVVDNEHYPEVNALTLGQYLFVLKRVIGGDYLLKEYAQFLNRVGVSSRTVINKNFMSSLEKVVRNYRNTIAHQDPMNKEEYEHLKTLVLSGKKALLKICGKIGVDGSS